MKKIILIGIFILAVSLFANDYKKLKYLVDYSLIHSPEYIKLELNHKINLLNIDITYYVYKPNFGISASTGSNISSNSKFLDYSYKQDLNDWASVQMDLYDYLDSGVKNHTLSQANIDINKLFTNYTYKKYRLLREKEELNFIYNR